MKVLVVVDMQNDFIDGALGTPEAQAIVPNVIEKIKQYKENGDPVYYTQDTHFHRDYFRTMEGKKLPVEHCIHGSTGWMIPEEIRMGSSTLIRKDTFGSYSLPQYIESVCQNPVSIEIIGLCTDICVISNAMILKATFADTPIIVDSSCCAGVTPESHQRALEAMNMCHIDIV